MTPTQAIETVLHFAPNHIPALALRMQIYKMEGNQRQYQADYVKMCNISPEDHYGYMQRATHHLAQKRVNEALADYTSAIELYRFNPLSYMYRSKCYYLLGKEQEAKADKDTANALIKSQVSKRKKMNRELGYDEDQIITDEELDKEDEEQEEEEEEEGEDEEGKDTGAKMYDPRTHKYKDDILADNPVFGDPAKRPPPPPQAKRPSASQRPRRPQRKL